MHLIRSFAIAILVSVAVGVITSRPASGQAFGFSTEPFLPVGKFGAAADIGWGATGYYSLRLGRKAPWAFVVDVAVQWHAGDVIDPEVYPDLPPDESVDGDAVALSGWMLPVRGSLTRIFGRAYFSPRVGLYVPAGDLSTKLGMEPSFGISPRIGHLFFVTRDLTADLGIEYTVVFDEQTVMYVGFGFGFLLGGDRLPRRRLPY